MHAIHAHCAEQLQFFAQAGEPRRRLLGCEELARMRLENHHRRLQSSLLSRSTQFVEQRLMAEMHTVEITDGDRHSLCVCRM